MIRADHLCKRYGRFLAVRDVSFEVAPGQVFGFLGLNGAGKTTVLRMVAGLLRPSSGRAHIGRHEVWGPGLTPRLARQVGIVSQELYFHERATLSHLIDFYADVAGVSRRRGYELAEELEVPLNRPARLLSPGQQRKAQLAVVLMKEPRYLLLDEPGAGLDPWALTEIRQTLRTWARRGTTVLLSSHLLAEVGQLCCEVAILHDGRIQHQGPVGPNLEETFLECIGRTRRAVPS